MADNQGKKVPQQEAVSESQLESNIGSAAATEEGHEGLVKEMRVAVKNWQRSDQLHDMMHEVAAGSRPAPILVMSLRGPDGQPCKIEVDVATWSKDDVSALCSLFINNTSTVWLSQLADLRSKIDKVDDLYAN